MTTHLQLSTAETALQQVVELQMGQHLKAQLLMDPPPLLGVGLVQGQETGVLRPLVEIQGSVVGAVTPAV